MAELNDEPYVTRPDDQAFANKWHEGLSKREYFAVAALQGLLAHGVPHGTLLADTAFEALQYADALIVDLNGGVPDHG